MDSLYALIRPRMEDIRDSIRADVRALLTAAQQERFLALSARLDARRQEQNRRDTTNP
jgi:hypothetical protein